MIHTDSVKAWAAESETFRGIIIERNKEIAHLVIANDAFGRRINELEGEIERLRAALQALVDDVLEYERINNLSPNPGKQDCWQSITNAKVVLGRK